MRTKNPLFRRFSRLNELQVVDMALSELERSIQQPRHQAMNTVSRVGMAMKQKIKYLPTAPYALSEIIRRALSSPPNQYACLTDMILDLHRARAEIESEMQARLQKKKDKETQKPPLYERALKPMTTALCILICVGSLTGIGILIHYLYPNGMFLTTVEIPQWTGHHLNDIPTDGKLYRLDITYQFHSDSKAGTVLSQSPPAGMLRHVSPGRHPCTVTLHVSLGPEQVQVGDYAGMTKYQALTECRRLGLIPKVQTVSDHPAGNVAKSDPPTGTILTAGSDITLYVGNSRHVSRIAVPNLIGNSEIGASNMISSIGLICSHVSYMTSDSPVGTVIAQSILSGTAVDTGTNISIVVSKGKTS